jgi:putative toxin-antitoxin system antitoxin component (TIGR02293 family)
LLRAAKRGDGVSPCRFAPFSRLSYNNGSNEPLERDFDMKTLTPPRTSARGARRDKLWRDLLSRRLPLASLYPFDAIERVELVKEGVPADLLVLISEDMAITRDKLYATIGLARATVNRKLREQQVLSQDESERVLGIARLVGQVDAMVKESGNPKGFDAAKWVAAWLDRPQPALGGKRPAELMDTSDGRSIVSDLIARMQSGAYA